MGPTCTGGQYSVFRALFGGYLIVQLVALIAAQATTSLATSAPLFGVLPHLFQLSSNPIFITIVLPLATLAAALLAVGWHDRSAAGFLVLVWISLLAHHADAGQLCVGLLLVTHTLQSPAPYGSLSARGRLDPSGGWRPKPWLFIALWSAMTAGYSLAALARFGHTPWADDNALQLALSAPLVHPAGVLLLHLATFNSRWVAAHRPPQPELLFYDGNCGMCHGFVRFLLAEDPNGAAVRFAPIESESFKQHVPLTERDNLPDSAVLLRNDGELLTRSAAVLHLLRALGGGWGALGWLLTWVPRPLRDAAYDTVARLRHRIAKTPDAACPLLPPELAARFEA